VSGDSALDQITKTCLSPGISVMFRAMKSFITVLFLLFLHSTMSANAEDALYHVVSFKFKASASKQDITKVEDAFRALKQKIPEIASYKWGTNVSKENRDKGFTHCFILTFKDEKGRDIYIDHPDHKAFGKIVGPVLEDVFVIDFWSKN
jgi:hypothetical protein